ncbi:hypothetical protein BU14_0093s0036 [Porphyra umbilicalis]|uniref:Uncharacterized protein n=1 Tax=Porphyra umbilicalis TaxID=2786 RepID=A0A1X6PEC6_PORUM|nr:hypothetical protein BU14_0093s0036 [Porphyra umbilicalis]|eukprot:OSX78993.1 hypothetical protein BU14_0093s0036 [Porphyra umbilicalis]
MRAIGNGRAVRGRRARQRGGRPHVQALHRRRRLHAAVEMRDSGRDARVHGGQRRQVVTVRGGERRHWRRRVRVHRGRGRRRVAAPRDQGRGGWRALGRGRCRAAADHPAADTVDASVGGGARAAARGVPGGGRQGGCQWQAVGVRQVDEHWPSAWQPLQSDVLPHTLSGSRIGAPRGRLARWCWTVLAARDVACRWRDVGRCGGLWLPTPAPPPPCAMEKAGRTVTRWPPGALTQCRPTWRPQTRRRWPRRRRRRSSLALRWWRARRLPAVA